MRLARAESGTSFGAAGPGSTGCPDVVFVPVAVGPDSLASPRNYRPVPRTWNATISINEQFR